MADEMAMTGSASIGAATRASSVEPTQPPIPAVVHVVDDDERGLAACVRLLRAHGFDARGHASAALFLLARRDEGPTCLVLDAGLPGLSGEELQAALARDGDAMPVIFLTGRGDIAMSVRAMKAGAVDFLTKPVRRDVLFAAIGDALARSSAQLGRDAQQRQLRDAYAQLTPREREVLALVARGRLYKQIADTLRVSVRTVKAHRAQVMRKLGAGSLAELVHSAARLGIAQAD
jgi:RNA polymerase sigma factor (sigma-70 family)